MKDVFICQYCGKKLGDKTALTKHIRYYCELSTERIQKVKPICKPYTCEICGKVVTEKYGSGRFCSASCASKKGIRNSAKIAESLCVHYEEEILKDKICEVCGAIYHSKDHSRKKCFNCLPKTIRKAAVKMYPASILDVSKRTAEKIIKRMKLPCSCCGIYIDGVNWDIHHIVSKKLGGSDNMDNLTYICPNCHRIVHTNKDLLQNDLISIDKYLELLQIDWKDYYYGKV